jgi:hypothetical protein
MSIIWCDSEPPLRNHLTLGAKPFSGIEKREAVGWNGFLLKILQTDQVETARSFLTLLSNCLNLSGQARLAMFLLQAER